MKADIQIFEYEGSPVSFSPQGDTGCMINATQMAKPFGKRPVDWLKNDTTKQFIQALADVRMFTSADLMKVIKGGNNKQEQGTWFHEDVALEFARWLDPRFAIWCNDRIKELLRTGSTRIDVPREQENPRMFVKEGIGSLTAGIFDGGEVYVMAEDVFAILGIHDTQEKESLLEQYPIINLQDSTKSYARMIFVPFGSKEKQIMLCPAAVVGLFMQSGFHKHWEAAGWLLSEIIPTLRGQKLGAGGVSDHVGLKQDTLFSLLADVCNVADPYIRSEMARKICRLKESIN